MNLHQIYRPITANPFRSNEQYREYEPCEELKPYIRCFWGSRMPYLQRTDDRLTQDIVIPDTCMDVIFTVDFTNNRIDSKFCGIDDSAFVIDNTNLEEKEISVFAIRFYPWSVFLFAEESMRGTKNAFFDVDVHFSGLQREMEKMLFDVVRIEDRISLAERYLLKKIHSKRNSHVFMDAVFEILKRKGNVEIGQLSKEIHTSSRQLERMFRENAGISPKRLSSLIRYQYLWSDMLFSAHFQIADAVYKYGYSDQPHLLHDFKRFHTMNPEAARDYAIGRCKKQNFQD